MSSGLMPFLMTGFVLGLRHAFDADHVVAVSSIIARERRLAPALWLAMVWSLGHGVVLLAVGMALLGFKVTLPPALANNLELVVGLLLVGLGATTLDGWRRKQVHAHRHRHADGIMHVHFHVHHPDHDHIRHGHGTTQRSLQAALGTGDWARSLVMGLVQGLAGSGALMVLVMSTAPGLAEGMAYVGVFGAGSILGMLLVSVSITLPVSLLAVRWEQAPRHLSLITGTASAVIGLRLVISHF